MATRTSSSTAIAAWPATRDCNEAANYDGCFTRPDSVLVYDYPNTTASGEWYNSAYFNDKITLSRKFTLNVGVRYDRYSSFLPEQGNPGTGPFATANIFPYQGESNYPIYSTFVPRVSAVYDITGQGRVAVRASYGRYVGGSSGASANPGPGASDVNPNAIITRTYSNWDGTIPYVPNPANLTSTSGGGTQRSIDQDLKGPYVDEYTAGLDLGLSRAMTLQFNYVRKIDGNPNKTLNLALPYEAYTVVTNVVDVRPRQRHRHERRSHDPAVLGAAHVADVRSEHRAHRPGRRQQQVPRDRRDAEQAAVEQVLVPCLGRQRLP